MKRDRLAVIGSGSLSRIVIEAVKRRLLEDYECIGVLARSEENAKELIERIPGSRVFTSLEDLIRAKPKYVVEAASIAFMKNNAVRLLKEGISIVTLSIGALADQDFYKEVEEAAKEGGAQVFIASGAIGGLDVLRTVALMFPDSEVTFETEKGPRSLKNTPVYEESLQTRRKEVFSGNAVEAIELFPTKVNVAVAASIASVGPQKTRVSIHSVPDFVGDDHKITMKNNLIHAVIDVYSKNAEIAGWSAVNTLRNIKASIVF